MKRLTLILLVLAVAAGAQAQYAPGSCYSTSSGITCQSGSTLTMASGSTLTLSGTVTCTGVNIGSTPITTGNVSGTIGDVTTDDWSIITDGTGDSEVAVPENSIGPDEVAVFHDTFIACGENAENGTTYFGPGTAQFLGNYGTALNLGSAGCDALDNATEATADAPLVAGLSYKITGMWCQTDGTLGAGETIDFTLRSAEAGTTPAITCQITEGQTYCRTKTGSTTDIAAGATIAVKVVQVSNNADDNAWCKIGIALK